MLGRSQGRPGGVLGAPEMALECWGCPEKQSTASGGSMEGSGNPVLAIQSRVHTRQIDRFTTFLGCVFASCGSMGPPRRAHQLFF